MGNSSLAVTPTMVGTRTTWKVDIAKPCGWCNRHDLFTGLRNHKYEHSFIGLIHIHVWLIHIHDGLTT